jgi:hypothetical protein
MGSFLKKASFGLALPFALLSLMSAQTPTTTTLAISPYNSVALDTVVTLTATVTNPGAVTAGTVNFCNVNSTDCSPGSGLYGTAQLTSSGTATIKHVFGYGVNNIKTVFLRTTANASSTSLTESVSVSGSPVYTSATTLGATGSAGNYTLSGAVTAFGSQPLTGTIDFLDTTSGNAQIDTTSLNLAVSVFANQAIYATGSSPSSVAVGDFNGDGKQDIAIANSGSNTVSVFLGNGDGTFQTQASYAVGGGPSSVVVGDFNGDGKVDLAVVNTAGNTISILLGNGDGTFQPLLITSLSGTSPLAAAFGDFNGDGKLDMVELNSSYTMCIFIGNGNGTFQSPNCVANVAGTSIVAGDFNGDGKLDIAVTSSIFGNLAVFLGNGDGTFSSPVHYSLGGWAPASIAVGDFNGDGKLDLAVVNNDTNSVSILLGNGDGSFQSQIAYAAGSEPLSVAVGDFNGDGKLDLAVVNGSGNTVSVLLGNGGGSFKAPLPYATGSAPSSIAVGDFNGDGKLDLATANENAKTASILLGEQIAGYSESGIVVYGTGTHYVLASYAGDTSRFPSQSPTVPLIATAFLPQTISFTPIASPVTIGVPPISLSATGGGTLNPVTFSVLSGPGYVSGNWLYVTGVGTIVVAADQAGNSPYSAAPEVTQSVVVNKITPTFSVSCSPNPVVYGANTTCTAVVSGGATGTVAFYDNGVLWATVSVSGNSASATGFAGQGSGTYSVTTSYSGDTNNNSASAGTTVTVTQAPQSITFTPPATPVTFGVAPIALSASASSGLGVSFSVLSGPGSVSGNILTITGAGTVVVAANQPGNIDYSAAPQVTQVVVVNKATPTLTWSTPAAIVYGTPLSGTQLNATSGGIAGSFVYTPTSGTVLTGGTHSLSVTFTPTDSTDYNNQTASVSLTVNPATAAVSVSCSPNPITYGSQTTTCTTTVGGSATGTVAWTINGGAWTTTGLSGGSTSAGGFNGYAAGSYAIVANYSGDSNYAAGSAPTTLTINKATPSLSWTSPANIVFGTPLSAAQLDATSGGVAGAFVYTPGAGTVLPVGSYSLSATFTPTDAANYNTATIMVPLVVVPATPGINVNCSPNPITYGPQTSTCMATVSAGATGSVAFFYNGTNWANVPVSGGAASASGFNNMPVGSYTIVANYSGDSNFNPASAFTTLTIGQAAPAVTLSCSPSSISLGSNTTCTASVPATDGTVAFYSTADLAGKWWNAAFPAGGGDLGATPVATTQDASLNYNITGYAWANAIAGPAGVDTTNIYARWTGTFISPTDGTYTIGVNSDDGANVYVNGTLLVNNLSVGQSAQADLTYTQSGQITLTAGTSNSIVVEYQQGGGGAGIQLLWTPPGASSASLLGWTVVPVNGSGQASITGGSAWNAGTYNVTGVYSGDANYAAATSNVVPVTVNQETPTVTVTCSPSTMVFGSTTSCTAHVSAGTGTVSFTGGSSQPGPWVETVNGSGNAVLTGLSNWAAGTYTVQATYSGDSNYNGATGSTVLTITTSTPVLTWATPAAITYGTALSATQLNASSSGLAGTFAYTPAAGTILAAGSQTLSVTFTPTDLVDYTVQTATVTLLVNKAALTVTPNPASRLYGVANPVFTGSITGVVAGDNITATYASGATAATTVGVYSSGVNAIAATPSDPGSKLGNYTLTQNLGTLTITQTSTVLSWATPAAITYGTPLSATQLDATSGGVAGTFVYTPAAGAVLAAGAQTLSVTFTPTDSADYSAATLTVFLTVNKAPLTVTPNNASRLYGVANPTFTGSITGLVAGDTITATYASAANLTTIVGVYSSAPNAIAATLSDPGSKLGNYTLTQNVGTLTITQTTTTLTWPTPAAITYGTPLSATQLATTSGGIAGTFVYTPATGTILTAGSQTLSVVFTPIDGADYSTATTTVLLTVNKASLTVTPNPSSKVYGTANPAFTGSITGLVTGDTITASYASAAATSTAIGVYSLGANAIAATLSDPGSRLGNYTVTQNLGTLTITQATTILTWPTPAAITYGTPLSATQLDATSGGVAGTFGYSPVAGTVLAAGPQTLSVTFTPNDTADYSVATLTVALTVNKAPLTVSPNSASRLYGVANPVFTGSIIGLVAGDTITATYASAANMTTVVGVYPSGANAIAATLSDPESKLPNYTLTQNLGTLTITQTTTVLTWANPAAITYGTALSAAQLDATSGGVAGTFVYAPPAGTILPVGVQTLSVTFTPTDGADYSSATVTVSLTVNKAPLTVTPTPASKVYGTANPIFTGSITGLVAGDTITATYASAATTSTAVGVYSSGVNAISATLSDPDSKLSNYTLTQNVGALTVTQATTVLTWATPAAITYGTPLSAVQLNATSGGVAGTFVYTPAAGVVLAAGSHTLSVMFTPTDTADYGSAIATVNLQVNKAALVVTPNPASRLYAAANPVFTGAITGMIAGDGISATYASGANATTPVGIYSTGANAIASTMVDPGSKLANYTVTQNLGALTITQVTTGLTWPTPAAITYGTALTGVQLDATSGGVVGTFVYSPAAGAVLSAGIHTLNVTFTPTDGADYSTATASVTLTVTPAVLTVTPAPSSKVYGTANPVFSGSITGMIPGDGITATYASAATPTTIVGIYSSGPDAIAATLSDPGAKLGNYTLNQTAGALTITQATTVLTWATPASISYETALSATQLNATSGGVAGTFVYTPAAGTILTAGSHTLSVAFTPTDAVDYSAASATVTLTVTKATPTVVLASSANPSVYGVAVTFTARTNAAATGTMLFYDGGLVLGPGTITGGVATYTLNNLGAGTHSITAGYAGDSNYLAAVSAAVSQVVTRAPVAMSITSSLNPSNFGQSVTFTFTVTGVAGLTTPTGSIAFTDGGTLLASPTLNPLGVATYTTVTLSGGSHSLAAVYGGDANYQ